MLRWQFAALQRAWHIGSGQFCIRKIELCAKALSISFSYRSGQRGAGERDRDDKEALVFQETPLCQPITGWQGSRETTPSETYRRSAGSNMCLHYNLHCNQNLTGDRPGSLRTANWQRKKGERVRQTEIKSYLMRGEISQVIWARACYCRCLIAIWLQYRYDQSNFTQLASCNH